MGVTTGVAIPMTSLMELFELINQTSPAPSTAGRVIVPVVIPVAKPVDPESTVPELLSLIRLYPLSVKMLLEPSIATP
jgi:hypothetical protein